MQMCVMPQLKTAQRSQSSGGTWSALRCTQHVRTMSNSETRHAELSVPACAGGDHPAQILEALDKNADDLDKNGDGWPGGTRGSYRPAHEVADDVAVAHNEFVLVPWQSWSFCGHPPGSSNRMTSLA